MLPNELFALACLEYYRENDLIVDETNGEFAHCPAPEEEGDTGYYLLWEHHQQQGLLQSRDYDRICFFNGDAKKWLIECDPFPDDYFDLWDIYCHYTKKVALERIQLVTPATRRRNMEKLHSEKNQFGKSVQGVKNAERLHSVKYRCLVTGHVSNAGGLSRYQIKRQIDTSLREVVV